MGWAEQAQGLRPSPAHHYLQTLCKYFTCCLDNPCMDYFWTALADAPKQVTTLPNQHLWDLKGGCVIPHVHQLIQRFIKGEPHICYTGQYALQTSIFLGLTYSLCSFSMQSLHLIPFYSSSIGSHPVYQYFEHWEPCTDISVHHRILDY